MSFNKDYSIKKVKIAKVKADLKEKIQVWLLENNNTQE